MIEHYAGGTLQAANELVDLAHAEGDQRSRLRRPLVWGLYGAHYVKRYLLCADAVCWTGMGIGLAAVWTALGRSTLYPVGPQRVPDQHPTCVGHVRPGG